MTLDPKVLAEFDQASQLVAETIPPLLYRLYVNLVDEGFTSEQAMDLVKSYLGGLRGSNQAG